MANFNLTNMAVKMFCPDNVVQMDDAGLPSILVYIPAFKNSDVLTGGDDSTHPAFIVNGKEIPGFYYSKYQNVVHNGKAYSLPGEDPMVNVTVDQAREYCEAKGYGWHLSTNSEWAAIALWCMKNGISPCGNNNNGKDFMEASRKAIPTSYNADNSISRVATGTGPLTWSHDNTTSGIWDMNGNIWEIQGGIRLVWGELQILSNNDAADPNNPQNATSTCWKAINAADGSLVAPENKTTDTVGTMTGNTVKLDYDNDSGTWVFSTDITNAENTDRGSTFYKVTCSDLIGDKAIALLRSLALLPDSGYMLDDFSNDCMWWNNAVAECLVFRGGDWTNISNAGMFCSYGINRAHNNNNNTGFRAAYIPDIE